GLGRHGLDALGSHIRSAEGGDRDWHFCRVQQLFNHMLEFTSPHVASLVGVSISDTQPHFAVDDGEADGWLVPAGPFQVLDDKSYLTDDGYRVEGADAEMSWQDLLQGVVGDCWFLTSIQAVAKADPTWLPRHI